MGVALAVAPSRHPHLLPGKANDIPRTDLAPPASVDLPVDGHLTGIDHRTRSGAVVDEACEFQQLSEADALVADLDVDWLSTHGLQR